MPGVKALDPRKAIETPWPHELAMKTEGSTSAALLGITAALGVALASACSSNQAPPPTNPGGLPFITKDFAPPPASFCSLPGSVVQTPSGPELVPGGADAGTPDLAWLQVPVGFCAHVFATVPTARQLKFAPGGDLFVASPTWPTTGGNSDGLASIVVLPDDDHDGVADVTTTFLPGLAKVQGLMFANGSFYYQDGPVIRSVPFNAGDRQPSASSAPAADMSNLPQDPVHWPKVFDTAMDGTIYVTNGGSQGDACLSTDPVKGAVFTLNADGTTTEVAKGFRNPIALRCESNHNQCLAIELALDYSAGAGGREKLLPIRPGDDWGYPCCATQNLPYSGVMYTDTNALPDCSGVADESASFVIGDTPFGLDFETGKWPAPWGGRVFVALHGAYLSWKGARVVAIALDPTTGLPLPSSELAGSTDSPDNMLAFATGWDDGKQDHGRPAPVAFAPDGRLFLGNDWTGTIVWMAPVSLMQK